MSISPVCGHVGPFVQKAGHVPHPVGMWTLSMMTSPPVKLYCVWMRTDARLPDTWGVVSTLMIAFPALLMDERLLDCAVAWFTYCTTPLVGSPPVKKSHPEKNVFPE
jgi:hypothetical protein